MAGSSSSLFDKAFAKILAQSPEETYSDADQVPGLDREYNFQAYVSEKTYVDEEPWGDLTAEVRYQGQTMDKFAVLRNAGTLEIPKTAQKSVLATAPDPPTTKLMQKLFKPAQIPATKMVKQPEVDQDALLQKFVDEKIEELNKEVEKRKLYKEKLNAVSRQIGEKTKMMEKEMRDLEELEEGTKEEVKGFREAEMTKAEKEFRIRERNQKALSNLPSRKEREEKESLQSSLQRLQEEAKTRKSRHQLAKSRLQKQLEDAKTHYQELIREKERMMQIMPVEMTPDTREVETGQGREKKEMGFRRAEGSPRAKEPVESTFEESLPPAQPQRQVSSSSSSPYEETIRDGKICRVFSDGHEETLYQNGSRSEVYPNGYVVTHFSNSDEKRDFPSGKSVYFYASPGTTHIIQPDGIQRFTFADGQREKHYPDGSRKIRFPDGTVKVITESGEETCVFLDGIIVKTDFSGTKTLIHPGGHTEVTYPDGRKIRQMFNGAIQRLA